MAQCLSRSSFPRYFLDSDKPWRAKASRRRRPMSSIRRAGRGQAIHTSGRAKPSPRASRKRMPMKAKVRCPSGRVVRKQVGGRATDAGCLNHSKDCRMSAATPKARDRASSLRGWTGRCGPSRQVLSAGGKSAIRMACMFCGDDVVALVKPTNKGLRMKCMSRESLTMWLH